MWRRDLSVMQPSWQDNHSLPQIKPHVCRIFRFVNYKQEVDTGKKKIAFLFPMRYLGIAPVVIIYVHSSNTKCWEVQEIDNMFFLIWLWIWLWINKVSCVTAITLDSQRHDKWSNSCTTLIFNFWIIYLSKQRHSHHEWKVDRIKRYLTVMKRKNVQRFGDKLEIRNKLIICKNEEEKEAKKHDMWQSLFCSTGSDKISAFTQKLDIYVLSIPFIKSPW